LWQLHRPSNNTSDFVKGYLDYQKDDTTTSINYERMQSTNNKAHSYGIEGTVDFVKGY
jgi:hypothetical protein